LNNLLEPFQSGFKSGHSTETALVWVTNDLFISADMGARSILVLLDITAAFDTISLAVLLDRLSVWLGISGTALKWFTSYFTNRFQFVSLGKKQIHTYARSAWCPARICAWSHLVQHLYVASGGHNS